MQIREDGRLWLQRSDEGVGTWEYFSGGTPSVTLVGGVLTIFGTGEKDTITVSSQGNLLIVKGPAGTSTFAFAAVRQIVVHAGAGDDSVNLSGITGPTLAAQLKGIPATVYGGAGNDTLKGGTPAVNDLHGQGGNDRLYGNLGSDWLFGGAGNDYLSGGGGNDALSGDTGDDCLFGGGGADKLTGGGGGDLFLLQPGDTPLDLGSNDAQINFVNGGWNTGGTQPRAWRDPEIEAIAEGLMKLQARTHNTRLLTNQQFPVSR